jgi:hypothetical protein
MEESSVFRDSNESPEDSEKVTCTLLQISSEQLSQIRDRIKAVRGHVRISVHPQYIERRPDKHPKEYGNVNEVLKLLATGFERTTKSVNTNSKSSPLFIFEEERHVGEMRHNISEQIGTSKDQLASRGFVFIPTMDGSGQLSIRACCSAYDAVHGNGIFAKRITRRAELRKIIDQIEGQRDEGAWKPPSREEFEKIIERLNQQKPYLEEVKEIDKKIIALRKKIFADVFHTFGIKSALISGAYFHLMNIEEVKELQGCAGYITDALRKSGILVDVSRYSSQSKDELKKEGIETKQTGKE